jgi:FeS assembly SUF system regulator
MLKLSKLTDYAIILLSVLSKDDTRCFSTPTLSAMTSIPEPTAAKVLKMLASGGVVVSVRGAHGGYRSIGSYEQTPLSQIIDIMEGGIALTDCASGEDHNCSIKEKCPMDGCWNSVNKALYETLNTIKLSSLLSKAELRETL